MKLISELQTGETKVSVIGLGYVGISIAYAFATKVKVIGYDINENRINRYKSGIDITNQIGDEKIKESTIEYTSDERRLQEAKFHIVAVPTPVKNDNIPDVSFLENASHMLGKNLVKGSVVVYESTVFPGATREICIPILEKESNLICGKDFTVGYSPERINPGDTYHTFSNIQKIVSGYDKESLDTIAEIYSMAIEAGVYKAESLEIAEAAKVIENSQRDINIAFINEVSMIFHKLGIDTGAVLNAASTKWNFIRMSPGLVGGHCIGVDPYYLIYKAQKQGYESTIMSACRQLNNGMSEYIVENTIQCLDKADIQREDAKVAILGFTFKENCNDIRNTKMIDIYNQLEKLHMRPYIFDPNVDENDIVQMYGKKLNSEEELKDMDVVIFAVSHDQYLKLSKNDIDSYYSKKNKYKILIDIKEIFEETMFDSNYIYWRL